MTNYIFVYGTLRPGERAHSNFGLDRDAKHKGTFSVPGLMFSLGGFPGVKFKAEPCQTRVIGDLFEMDEPEVMLRALDSYEGFDGKPGEHNLYNRVLINVAGVEAWSYEYTREPPMERGLMPLGDWRDAQSR